MSIAVACHCGAQYSLKDEFAGNTVKCTKCNNVLQVPGQALPQDQDSAFNRDKFLLRQKALTISEKYYVWDDAGQQILFIERPAHLLKNLFAVFMGILVGGLVAGGIFFVGMIILGGGTIKKTGQGGPEVILGFIAGISFFLFMFVVIVMLYKKRHITVYRDDSKQESLLEVSQDKRIELITATFTLRNAGGDVLASFYKNYLYNVFRRRWYCYGPEGSLICVAMEDSLILSLLRRVLGTFFGLLRTNFIILKGESENVIGEFNRKFTLLDRYVLDMSADRTRHVPRRVALALGILLDTGERR